MARKRPKNLLLSPAVLVHAEEYCDMHGTSLSVLVEDYLRALPPLFASREIKSPIVQRLSGATSPTVSDIYRDFLFRKELEALSKRRFRNDEDLE